MNIVLSCEHGGKEIPPEYAPLFKGADEILLSHRGWDPGALGIATAVGEALQIKPYTATVTRLLVDLNRSLDNPTLFSEFVPESLRPDILKEYYFPYRKQVEQAIDKLLPTLHLSFHTFTPVLEGDIRTADIGILYDPERKSESLFSESLLEHLAPHYRTKMNYPYLGTSDGITTHLRSRYTSEQYAGIELEVSQAIAYDKELIQTVVKAFVAVLSIKLQF